MRRIGLVSILNVAIVTALAASLAFAAHVISIPSAPPVPSSIGRTDPLSVSFTYSNTGSTDHKVTALLVFTAPGATTGIEIYKTGLTATPGTSTHTISLDSAERLANGVAPGRWLVTVTGFNEADGSRLETYPGNPLTIGSMAVTLDAVSSLASVIGRTDPLSGTFTFSNTGDTTDAVSALYVFTAPGSTTGKEIYKTGLAVAPGTVTHTVALTAADLDAKEVTPGRWLVTRTAFDGREGRLRSFPGHLLTRGTIAVSLASISAIPREIRSADTLSVDFTFTNTGDTTDTVSATLIFTPAEGGAGIEFYFTGLSAPAGSVTHRVSLTSAQRGAKGIGVGHWRVSATGFDGAGRRLETFGGPLDISL